MRITKEPEERKQEIIETAMCLFNEKGYEKTSIADIAKAIGVAQGLCYRYFPSKEALFDCTVDQYAQLLANKLSPPIPRGHVPLRKLLAEMPADVDKEDTDSYKLFHKSVNKKFHNQLLLKVCEKLAPRVLRLFEEAKKYGEIGVEDVETAAFFCVYGQLGILLNDEYEVEEKRQRIHSFLMYALRL